MFPAMGQAGGCGRTAAAAGRKEDDVRNLKFVVRSAMALAVLVCCGTAWAADASEKKGWGVGDAYNRFYNPKELEKIKAKVVKLTETAPMPGMSPVVALEVREGNQTVTVHLCPSWFAKPAETGIRPGDDVVIRGSWAEINGKDVFMASKVKKGESQEFKVRLTKDGTPFWTMTPEQLARERAAKDD
jgi:hypothetical protein